MRVFHESVIAEQIEVAFLSDLVPYIDTENSPHIPSFSDPLSCSQSSTNTDEVLGACNAVCHDVPDSRLS